MNIIVFIMFIYTILNKNDIIFLIINKTPLLIALEKKNIDIFKILLSDPNIDVNIKCIYNLNF